MLFRSYEEYHPFGTTAYQATNSAINAVAKRYRFTGKERDEESGLNYHGARYYTPWLCKWSAADPKENERVGLSPYDYCSNNPINFQDPNGMEEKGKTVTSKTPPTSGQEVQIQGKSTIEYSILREPKTDTEQTSSSEGNFKASSWEKANSTSKPKRIPFITLSIGDAFGPWGGAKEKASIYPLGTGQTYGNSSISTQNLAEFGNTITEPDHTFSAHISIGGSYSLGLEGFKQKLGTFLGDERYKLEAPYYFGPSVAMNTGVKNLTNFLGVSASISASVGGIFGYPFFDKDNPSRTFNYDAIGSGFHAFQSDTYYFIGKGASIIGKTDFHILHDHLSIFLANTFFAWRSTEQSTSKGQIAPMNFASFSITTGIGYNIFKGRRK